MYIRINDVDPVILAAGKTSESLEAWKGIRESSRLEVGGETMLSKTISAIVDAGFCTPLVVGIPDPTSSHMRWAAPEKGRDDLTDSIEIALSRSDQTKEWLLISTVDMPFITARVIQNFFERSAEIDDKGWKIDIFYPVSPLESCEKACPGMKRSSLPIGSDAVSGGNLFLIRRKSVRTKWDWVLKAVEDRKKPWRLVKLVGGKALARILFAMLFKLRPPFQWAEDLIWDKVGLKAKVLLMHDPALVIDLDNETQWREYEAQHDSHSS